MASCADLLVDFLGVSAVCCMFGGQMLAWNEYRCYGMTNSSLLFWTPRDILPANGAQRLRRYYPDTIMCDVIVIVLNLHHDAGRRACSLFVYCFASSDIFIVGLVLFN